MRYAGLLGAGTLAAMLAALPAHAFDDAQYPDWSGQWKRPRYYPEPGEDMAAAARERIAADVRDVLGEEAVKSRFVATSQLISPGTSAEFAASIEEQRSKLAAIAQKLGVKAAQ